MSVSLGPRSADVMAHRNRVESLRKLREQQDRDRRGRRIVAALLVLVVTMAGFAVGRFLVDVLS